MTLVRVFQHGRPVCLGASLATVLGEQKALDVNPDRDGCGFERANSLLEARGLRLLYAPVAGAPLRSGPYDPERALRLGIVPRHCLVVQMSARGFVCVHDPAKRVLAAEYGKRLLGLLRVAPLNDEPDVFGWQAECPWCSADEATLSSGCSVASVGGRCQAPDAEFVPQDPGYPGSREMPRRRVERPGA